MPIIPCDLQYKNDFIRPDTDWMLRGFGAPEPPDAAATSEAKRS